MALGLSAKKRPVVLYFLEYSIFWAHRRKRRPGFPWFRYRSIPDRIKNIFHGIEASHHLQAVAKSAFGTGDATRHSNPLRCGGALGTVTLKNINHERH
jgi:hypothetical protein